MENTKTTKKVISKEVKMTPEQTEIYEALFTEAFRVISGILEQVAVEKMGKKEYHDRLAKTGIRFIETLNESKEGTHVILRVLMSIMMRIFFDDEVLSKQLRALEALLGSKKRLFDKLAEKHPELLTSKGGKKSGGKTIN